MIFFDWSERPVQDEFLAIRELTGLTAQQTWMRYVPGIPPDAVFAHGVEFDRALVAEMVEAAATGRRVRDEAEEAVREEKRARRRKRAREKREERRQAN